MDVPARYWPAAWVVLAVAVAITVLPAIAPRRGSPGARIANILRKPWLFLALLVLLLFAFRWLGLLVQAGLDPDEPQVIAQAITIANVPLIDAVAFYGEVQSGSTGVLWTYFLIVPHLFGFEINYASARFMGLVLLWISCVALYVAVKKVSGEMPARIAALSATLCFATGFKPGFLHYSSEHPAFPVIAFGTLLVLGLRDTDDRRPRLRAYLSGLLLGVIPFAKLQPVIVGLAVAATAHLAIATHPAAALREKTRRALLLTAGGLSLPAVLLGLYALRGQFGYFFQVYLVHNYYYKVLGEPFGKLLSDYVAAPSPGGLNLSQPNFDTFFFATAAFMVVGLVLRAVDRVRGNRCDWWPLFFAAVLLASSWWAVIAPGRSFPHYLLLAVFPTCLFCGLLMGALKRPDGSAERVVATPDRAGPAWLMWLGAACLVLPLAVFCFRPLFHTYDTFYFTLDRAVGKVVEDRRTVLPPLSARVVNRYKKPGDRLTVWGWRADYHIETQLPMGTRSACPENQIREVPLRQYFRRTALEELRHNRPAFFIDAAGPLSHEFNSRARHGHHIFPDLALFIGEHYTLYRDFGDDRLYIRNDRHKEIFADD